VFVDLSALIPLSRVGRLDLLRTLYGRLRTTRDVYRECVEAGGARLGLDALKAAFRAWIEVVDSPRNARQLAAAEGIEVADASLVLLCEREGEELLASDEHLLKVARARGVRGRWLTGALLIAVRRRVLETEEAKGLLTDLVRTGLHVSPEVFAEIYSALDGLESSEGRR